MIEGEIVKTDTAYRAKLFVGYGILIAVIFLCAKFGLPALLTYFHRFEYQRFLTILDLLLITFTLSFAGPSAYVIYIGKKIVGFASLPYPGMKVIRDTKVITGQKAIFQGKLLIWLGYVAIALAVASSIITHYYIGRLRVPW